MDHLFVSHSGFCSHVGARAVSRSTSRGRGTHAHIVRNSNESGLTRTEKRTTLCYPHVPRDCLVDPTRHVPRVLGGWALSLWERYPMYEASYTKSPSSSSLLLSSLTPRNPNALHPPTPSLLSPVVWGFLAHKKTPIPLGHHRTSPSAGSYGGGVFL